MQLRNGIQQKSVCQFPCEKPGNHRGNGGLKVFKIVKTGYCKDAVKFARNALRIHGGFAKIGQGLGASQKSKCAVCPQG